MDSPTWVTTATLVVSAVAVLASTWVGLRSIRTDSAERVAIREEAELVDLADPTSETAKMMRAIVETRLDRYARKEARRLMDWDPDLRYAGQVLLAVLAILMLGLVGEVVAASSDIPDNDWRLMVYPITGISALVFMVFALGRSLLTSKRRQRRRNARFAERQISRKMLNDIDA